MKIVSWNVNGIRACIRNGFWDWCKKTSPDIVCLQETKITEKDFEKIAEEYNLKPLNLTGQASLPLSPLGRGRAATAAGERGGIYYALSAAQRPGYSGVALLTKTKPKSVELGIGI